MPASSMCCMIRDDDIFTVRERVPRQPNPSSRKGSTNTGRRSSIPPPLSCSDHALIVIGDDHGASAQHVRWPTSTGIRPCATFHGFFAVRWPPAAGYRVLQQLPNACGLPPDHRLAGCQYRYPRLERQPRFTGSARKCTITPDGSPSGLML